MDTEIVARCYPVEAVTKFELKMTETEGWIAMKMESGGDDAADCFRYLVATKSRPITQRKLRGT
jgi:hypothetical protein